MRVSISIRVRVMVIVRVRVSVMVTVSEVCNHAPPILQRRRSCGYVGNVDATSAPRWMIL